MSYLRTFGAFAYSAVLSILFLTGAIFLLVRTLIFISGFCVTTGFLFIMLFCISWISERGLQFCSIPFNYLWDNTLKTRIASVVPAVIVGLWCVSAPFRLAIPFSVGDWIVSIVWMICCLVFYFNLAVLPLTNPHMGVNIDSIHRSL